MTSLRQLEVFVKVAELGSFTQAANQLFITQPAISWQIKNLEENAGVPLFRRRDKKLELSEAGKELLIASREMLTIYRRAEHALAQYRGLERGTFLIGASTVPGEYILPRILSQFCEQHSQIEMGVAVGSTGDILRRLVTGELDIAVVGANVPMPDVQYIPWLEDSLVGVMAPDFPLPDLKEVHDLTSLPLIARREDSGSRLAMEEALNRDGIKLTDFKRTVMLDSNQAVLTGVANGLGVAFVSMWAAGPAIKRGELALLPVVPFPWKRRFYIAQWRPLSHSPLLEQFKHFLLSQQPSL